MPACISVRLWCDCKCECVRIIFHTARYIGYCIDETCNIADPIQRIRGVVGQCSQRIYNLCTKSALVKYRFVHEATYLKEILRIKQHFYVNPKCKECIEIATTSYESNSKRIESNQTNWDTIIFTYSFSKVRETMIYVKHIALFEAIIKSRLHKTTSTV